MRANAIPLVALFETKMRLEIPLFQRQYVWGHEQQWEPLWEDISRKFTEYLEGRIDAPKHFLGAIVLDQKQTPATHVERRMVIDGQQRLTTLQVFLSSFRDYCKSINADALADECLNFTVNKGMMPNPETDKFKIWPTQLDRPFFQDVVTSGSPEILKEKYKQIKRKYQRKPDPRPKLIECYLFFFEQLKEFFESETSLYSEQPLADRVENCFQALRNALLVVAIDLEQGDDPQVIFETLNARGEPLLPADLLRNYIFLRASKEGSAPEELYNEYWQPFDDIFWRQTVSQGRINRPRSDLFMQHYLTSQQTADIPIKHLYVEYRHWIERTKPFESILSELKSLASYREVFRKLLEAERGHNFSSLARLLAVFDIGTAYPLMLLLLQEDRDCRIYDIIESYIIRRTICGLTNKNYNRVFLTLARNLKKEKITANAVARYFEDLRGDAALWPTDSAFEEAWLSKPIYNLLNNPRLVFILAKLNVSFLSSKSEDLIIETPMSVEHLMPQDWASHWPLPDGATGLSSLQLWDTKEDDPRYAPSARRDALVHSIGNLTVTTQPLNSALSNSDWEVKRCELANSLLPINKDLLTKKTWNEEQIEQRSRDLFARAKSIWPR